MYDGDRLVGSVTTREPEFTYQDRVAFLAWQSHQRDMGPDGFPLSETTDPANQRAYVADKLPTVDWAAKAKGDAMDAYYKQYPDASPHGHLWGVRRRSVAGVQEVVVPAE